MGPRACRSDSLPPRVGGDSVARGAWFDGRESQRHIMSVGGTVDASQGEIKDLLQRASAGDRAAVAVMLQQYRDRLTRMVAFRIDARVRARVDACDVVQETFVSAAQQLPHYLKTQPIPFYPWLRRIAWQTLARTHERHLDAGCRSVRRERRRALISDDGSAIEMARLLEANYSTPSGVLVRKELRRRIRTALDQLPALDREVLLQRYVEQRTIAEIAAASKLTEAAVYKRHARALTRLRSLIPPGEEEIDAK